MGFFFCFFPPAAQGGGGHTENQPLMVLLGGSIFSLIFLGGSEERDLSSAWALPARAWLKLLSSNFFGIQALPGHLSRPNVGAV